MRIDSKHTEKLAGAFTADGEIKLDIVFMTAALQRLTLWERGLLTQAIIRASRAKRKTAEQRILLALFVYDGGENETA